MVSVEKKGKELKKNEEPMNDEIERYIYGVKDNKCISFLQKNKENLPLEFIKKNRNKKCTNRTSMSDEDIGMYSEDQIILYNEGDNLFCFKYDETPFLLESGKNPFTGKRLDENFIKTLSHDDIRYSIPVYPLDKAIDIFQESGTCFRLPPFNPKVVYLISMDPIEQNKLPKNIPVINLSVTPSYYSDQIFISNTYDTADLGVLFIYRIHTKKDIDFSTDVSIKSADIKIIEKIFSSDDIETISPTYRNYYKIEDITVKKELKKYMNNSVAFSNRGLEKLKQLSIKEPFPIKVYRGLTYSDSNFINKYRVGDKFILRSRNLVQSWSSTHCVSEFFASTEKFGIIVSTILDPEDIAIDTRFLDMKQLRNFFWREQREIISVPFEKDGKTEKEFLVTVESLIVGPKKNRITDVKSMKYFSEFPDKDVDIFEYKLGMPISLVEAREMFFNSTKQTIDMNIIPHSQRNQIYNDTFIDPITLDEIPLDNVIQLKKCGTLMSRQSLDDILNSTTTVWQNRESVGFKCPITNTIYGNLVSYNFNDDFLPQKDGFLVIQPIKTYTAIKPVKNGEAIKNWFRIIYVSKNYTPYIFRSTGNGVEMFYPNDDSGKKIIRLLIDCFKKGNLFSFSKEGFVRHGRVHKKTSLFQDEFGYPDDTYEMRVTGELSSLGSTPFTAFFGKKNDKDKGIFVDPYPAETRWNVIDRIDKKPEVSDIPKVSEVSDISKSDIDRRIKRIKRYVTEKIRDISSTEDSDIQLKKAKLLFEYSKKNSIITDPLLKEEKKTIKEVLSEFVTDYPEDEYIVKMFKFFSGKK